MFEGLDALGSEKYPHGAATYSYGTAGFRTTAAVLDCAMFRVGLVAALRSKALGGQCIGVMVTASHNPEQDNGVKIVDPMGDMLDQSWEHEVTVISNAPNGGLEEALKVFVESKSIDMSTPCRVAIGYDTRPSSIPLSDNCKAGMAFLKADILDCGLQTTPQLHYMVRCTNDPSYGKASEAGYYSKLAVAFKKIMGDKKTTLQIDAANGVGACKTKEFAEKYCDAFVASIVNDGSGKLNHECGADFVKVGQKPPKNMNPSPGEKCVVFDGDADRVIYFYIGEDGKFVLLDGDKIATLIAGYLKEVVSALPLPDIKLGLVQTAYANGSSTKYAESKMGIEVGCTPTGVKHIHHKAKDYDIGVYFEANGHGTVLYSDKLKASMKAIDQASLSPEQKTKFADLTNVIDVTNETVGDALSDCLLVESVLSLKGISLEEWNTAYTDLPNRQRKVQVADRKVVTTTDAERICVTPEGLQSEIDALLGNYKDSRSFVRPSGTEDVVRVYAEAATREEADGLAEAVCGLVTKYCS